jgi:hypothetical protein
MTCPRAGTFIYDRICGLYFGAFRPHEWSNNAKAVLRAGEDATDWLAFSGRGCGASAKAGAPQKKNPDMKPGPVMPQRTSGHDDHSEDSGIS